MGTNYYVYTEECPHPCKHCTAPSEIHLGKSSAGWPFAFRSYPDGIEGIQVTDFASWRRLLDLGKIYSEYRDEVSSYELLHLIESKRDSRRRHFLYGDDYFDLDGNYFSSSDFC